MATLYVKMLREEELTDVETYRVINYLGAWLRFTEESYYQFLDGRLEEKFWNGRVEQVIGQRLRPELARTLAINSINTGIFAPEFSEWFIQTINERYK